MADESDINDLITKFCDRLTVACMKRRQEIDAEVSANRKRMTAWEDANRVDNPNPLGLNLLGRSTSLPSRTFRYGAPAPTMSGATEQTMPVIMFLVSRNTTSSFRTAKEQAKEVAEGKSLVCWGAHMSGKAKHVLPYVDGIAYTDGGKFLASIGSYGAWFQKLWATELHLNGLRDAAGTEIWYSNKSFPDELHVELPNAKFGQDDPRAAECVDEYARLRQREGKPQNEHFEKKLEPNLKETLKNSLEKYRVASVPQKQTKS